MTKLSCIVKQKIKDKKYPRIKIKINIGDFPFSHWIFHSLVVCKQSNVSDERQIDIILSENQACMISIFDKANPFPKLNFRVPSPFSTQVMRRLSFFPYSFDILHLLLFFCLFNFVFALVNILFKQKNLCRYERCLYKKWVFKVLKGK